MRTDTLFLVACIVIGAILEYYAFRLLEFEMLKTASFVCVLGMCVVLVGLFIKSSFKLK